MLTLKGELVCLRALEPEDLLFLEEVENNESLWELSATQVPFSRFILRKYLENSHVDIYEAKQLRLAIVSQETQKPLGFIDLFDFDPAHRRAGVGIVIASSKMRQKGFALESLKLLTNYAITHLKLHQLYANIPEDNLPSRKLFEKADFVQVGTKIDWILVDGTYKNEILYQLIKHVY
ncbi:GNAT family N-acetyltransferase [Mesonia sp. MT50]|uniref:GNAT family N-acetyltransferase n=1 Tax=Mesonia profundi TaxID=3070998 RepID=A0ABU1A1D7_9FLAO|nr:GNAT family N-acetyltransferase [Mesonia profundi]MDQ7917508.1 GNAT family N-acetyltransferase [Mesonia profundi]